MLQKNKFVIIFIFLLILISFNIPAQQPQSKPQNEPQAQQYVLWSCSDLHIRPDASDYTCSPASWSDVISDAVGIGVNYSIALGDCVEDIGSEQAWDYFWNNSGQTYGWNDTTSLFDWSQVLAGNHDGGWGLGLPDGYGGNFTYIFGNVMIIGIPDGYPDENSYAPIDASSWGGRYEIYRDWVNETIQNNQDKNILLFMHHGLKNTTWETGGDHGGGTWTMYVYENADGCSPGYGCGYAQDTSNTNYSEMTYWLDNNSMHLDAWVHGHSHTSSNEWNFVEQYGTFFIDDLKISRSGGSENRESVFFYFEEGSNIVTAKAYNHISNTWASTDYFPNTFNLTYNFTMEPQYNTAQFVSIDGGLNGTTLYNSTPVFVWTNISNTIQYHLQVATDSAFTNIVVNLTDINELNYPTEYDDSSNVTFTLPDAYELPAYNTYYCRVRGFVKG